MIDIPKGSDIFLNQGDLFFSNTPCVVKTILGSCVSVTLYNSRLHYAGMIHAMYPKYTANSQKNKLLYADTAVENLVKEFFEAGIMPLEIEVKLFGGGSVIKGHGTMEKIGERNIESAKNSLKKMGLAIASSDVGNDYGRKLIFDTENGNVFLKKIMNIA